MYYRLGDLRNPIGLRQVHVFVSLRFDFVKNRAEKVFFH
jgi:hypothetical protein